MISGDKILCLNLNFMKCFQGLAFGMRHSDHDLKTAKVKHGRLGAVEIQLFSDFGGRCRKFPLPSDIVHCSG